MQSGAVQISCIIVFIKLVFAFVKKKKMFWKRKYWISGAKTHRGLVSKEFLYDFNKLVLLFWIQAASTEEYITKQEMLDKELAII